jgi:predicted O-methyltransferase YrrM
MTKALPMKSSITSENVARYVVEKITTDSSLEARLREITARLPSGGMISGSDVGAFLAMLIKSTRSVKAIEIGTFTGYTALKIAAALPDAGRLICCDISTEWTDIGRPFWDEAGVSSKIDLRIGPALRTLDSLIDDTQNVPFDFAFIDADKTGYDGYYERCLKLIRPGGLILLDNMLWHGAVADANISDETTNAIRTLNEKISCDNRVDSVLITIGDGIMMARKK